MKRFLSYLHITLLYTKTITSAGNSFMCVCDKCAVWNSYPPWRLSGMCARPCCYGNWHCQLTRSLPFSPSMPSSPWGTQEHSLHTHTHTHTHVCLTLDQSTHYQYRSGRNYKREDKCLQHSRILSEQRELVQHSELLHLPANESREVCGFTVCITCSNHHSGMS